jgi:DNA-binding MarR family transcriptional regulator
VLERASGELSLSHYRVLAMVSGGNGRASRLAGRLALGKPAISAAVESLAARGLIARSDSDPDRRATQLQITAEGRKALADAESSMSMELADLLRRAKSAPAILAAIRELSLALDRRQVDREAKASPSEPTAHTRS